ncbi:MAG: ABC transporter ATP-binding protein, partial [Burkholderiaceae bacterium]|nr:ABC transporter ATP-binding protein [Burkholderiaceae bacterium]
ASTDPYVHQFVHAEPDGPVAFRYPAPPYEVELGLAVGGAARPRA